MGEQLPLFLFDRVQFNYQNLHINDCNDSANALLKQWPHWKTPIALIVGSKGSGKTHFATLWQKHTNAFIAETTNLERAIFAASEGQPVLLENIDQTEIPETELFHLMNSIKEMQVLYRRVSLLMTARSFPNEWHLTLKDLISRLRLIPIGNLKEPDDKLLKAVLKKRFQDKQLFVQDDVIDYIAMRMERSFSMLDRLVNEADRLALQKRCNITKLLMAQLFHKFEQEALK